MTDLEVLRIAAGYCRKRPRNGAAHEVKTSMTDELTKQLHVAQTRLEASRVVDHKLYLECWLRSMPSIQIAELNRIYQQK